jgi:hypothetical protein
VIAIKYKNHRGNREENDNFPFVLCVFSAFSAVIFLAIEIKYKNHRASREESANFLCALCVFSAFSAVIFLAIEIKYKNHRGNREGNDNFPLLPLRLLRALCGYFPGD